MKFILKGFTETLEYLSADSMKFEVMLFELMFYGRASAALPDFL